MKKLITTAAIVLCVMSTNAQRTNYIKRDTIEVLMYDSLGNEYHFKPPRTVIRYTEMGDPEYWKQKHKRDRKWDRASLGLFIIGTLAMWIIPITSK